MGRNRLIALMATSTLVFAACAAVPVDEPTPVPDTPAPAPETPVPPDTPEPITPAPETPDPATPQPTPVEPVAPVPDRLVIGYAPATYDFTDFFGQLDTGVRQGLEEAGVGYDIFMRPPADIGDHESYAASVQALIALGVDYIVAVPSQLDLHIETFRAVNDAGIPLIFAQPDTVEGVDAVQFAGASQFNAGEVAADYIIEMLGGEGNVALLHGQAGSFVDEGRVVHARTLMEEAGITIVAAEFADFARDRALSLTEDILVAHDDLDLIYAGSSAMALGAMTAVENAGRDIPVIGVGGIMEEIQMVLDGRLHATVFRDPAAIGRGIAETIIHHATGQTDQIEFIREFDHVVIDSCDDVVTYIPRLLFDAADVPYPTC